MKSYIAALKSWKKVFAFTLGRSVKSRGWLLATIIIALLILIGISSGMMIYELVQKSREALTETAIKEVLVVDGTPGAADYNYFNLVGDSVFNNIKYTMIDGAEAAAEKAGAASLILDVSYDGTMYNAAVVRPDASEIKKKDAKAFRDFVASWFPYILIQKSGVKLSSLPELSVPVNSAVLAEGEGSDEGLSGVRSVMSAVLPYIIILLIYNMVMIYGQSVAGSILLEKNSKLMDFFLISVRPESMVFGKMLAVALAGLLQLLAWIGAAAGGCALGAALVRAYNPGTGMPLLKFLDMLGEASGMFSPVNAALALVVVVFGFLMYCSISAIGGAMASKQEDLGATNALFTLILLASFFIAVYGGGLSNGEVAPDKWLAYVPFTAVLVTPARLLIGELAPLQGLISLALILVLMLLAAAFAGKVYKLTSFWRGNPPKLGAVVKMMRSGKGRA